MSRFCRFCGQELKKADARFCHACGRPVAASERQLAPADLPEERVKESSKDKELPRLVIRESGQSPQEMNLSQATFTIGRKPDNDIVLPPQYVSGYHGKLEQHGEVWHYSDLGSTNGTFINGQRTQSAVLNDGDILRIGDPEGNSVSLTFRAAGSVGAPAPAVGPIRMGATALGMQSSLTIGRDPQADIPLSSPVISWRHARLDRTAQGHVLTDLKSTNGTFVNARRLTQPQPLQQGDIVQIGPFKLVYEATGFQQYTAAGGVRLDGVQLVREVGSGDRKKRILNDINISIYPREFISLVGTSGAGKSTLMMALNGFARADGQVLVNGDDLYRQFDLYRTMVGYVPQDDIIHRDLTVGNALRYAARLRLPPDTSAEEIEQRIEQVLELVEMVGQKDQVVTSLSGGQRKRVSIAVELLAEPNLFFLDEPTSGLDPGLEKKMMHTLRRLADGGRTIVLVTHATANIVQCDHVCFLSQGRMVYFGPPAEALDFFGVTSGDFADIYAQLDDPDPRMARQKAAAGEEKFKQSSHYQRYIETRQRTLPQVRQEAASEVESRQRPKVSVIRQFLVLTRRYLDLVLRDKLLLAVLMLVMPIIGALVLLVSDANWLVGNPVAEIERQLADGLATGESSATYAVIGDSQTLLFIMALASVLLGLFASVYEIVKEKSIYQRERMVTLRIMPYIASKIVVLGVFALIQCLLLMLVINLKVDYPSEGILLPAPVEMYITLVLGTMAAILMGLLISALVPNANTVIYIVFLVLFFQMIFAGVLFDLPGITDQFSNLTLTRWSMEGLGTSANVEWLNTLTRTRFRPSPVTKEVSMDIEKPDEDWEPVTVVTTTQEIEIPFQPDPSQPPIMQTVPISVPQVTVNDLVTVTETMTETFTVVPEPMDIFSEQEFRILYTRTTTHLFRDWAMLIGFGLLFSLATAIVLRQKDVG
jgi:ABC-type multidrug transport system ATPase subunit/pSer/pThr/pTyr-binding forkhead associated (FHA) protein